MSPRGYQQALNAKVKRHSDTETKVDDDRCESEYGVS